MAEAVGLFVMRLARVSFAGITHEGLRAGQLRELTAGEASLLRRTYLGVDDPPARGRPSPTRTTHGERPGRDKSKRSSSERPSTKRAERAPASRDEARARAQSPKNERAKTLAVEGKRGEGARREARKAAAKNRGRA
jgi:23S rRNA pseudouridine2605 synthase